ncbi:hypothetical protein SBC1_54490 (plasmid) [Caballeronia sp. SBC1]|nr:hypothetical protein SBC1_54490 [Caballeronia sp. SBC1]
MPAEVTLAVTFAVTFATSHEAMHAGTPASVWQLGSLRRSLAKTASLSSQQSTFAQHWLGAWIAATKSAERRTLFAAVTGAVHVPVQLVR